MVVNANKLNDTAEELSKRLQGSLLQDIYQSGKEFHFVFSNKIVLRLPLMLSGDIYSFAKKNKQKFTIIEFHFQDRSGIALTDLMRDANVKLNLSIKKEWMF